MNISERIKSAVSLTEAIEFYGYHPNRSGFISCPFHSEKTASLSVKGDRFKCFGCGAGGTVIDFVMLLFNIPFPAAIVRLNADFRLGLTNDRPDPRAAERLRIAQAERERGRMEYEVEYMNKVMQFKRLWAAYMTGNPDDPAYCEAARKIDYLEYWFLEHPFLRGDTH